MSLLNLFLLTAFLSCNNTIHQHTENTLPSKPIQNDRVHDTLCNTIHVMVALCDNKYQGIVPVPAKIGNGQDLDNNLYWGCGYGVRSYFKNSKEWTLVRRMKIDSILMERLVFKHLSKNYYLIADAYNGKFIQQCTIDFLKSCAGQKKDTPIINNKTIGIYGNAKLVTYSGHDGLMDFRLPGAFENTDNKKRDAIIIACISKRFFAPYIKQTGANPVLWSTGLMSAEAYTLHDAITAYINKQPAEQIRTNAAKAYSKYTKCSEKAARGLLVSGW